MLHIRNQLLIAFFVAICFTFLIYTTFTGKLQSTFLPCQFVQVPRSRDNDVATVTEQTEKRNVFNYFRWKNEEACQFSYEFGGFVAKYVGIPGIDGQKAVCLDAGVAPTVGTCIVYSFGINNDFSFDEAMESYGCDVYAFDPSMLKGNYSHSARIKFFQLGIGTQNVDNNTMGWRIATLPRIWEEFGHTGRVIDFLKIDIEGGEWDVLRQLLDQHQLSKVKQLAVEFHLRDCNRLSYYQEFVENMERTGWVRFFSREAVWGRNQFWNCLKVNDSYAYEMSWYNSKFSLSLFKE